MNPSALPNPLAVPRLTGTPASELVLRQRRQRRRFLGAPCCLDSAAVPHASNRIPLAGWCGGSSAPEGDDEGPAAADWVLDGPGVERGIVLGVSAASDGRLISLHLLASILLSRLLQEPELDPSSQSIATIIDTTGSFPLALLVQILQTRIQEHNASPRARAQVANVEAAVRKCLELVAVSRVFDVDGLGEVLSETELVFGPSSPEPDTPMLLDEMEEMADDRRAVLEESIEEHGMEIRDSAELSSSSEEMLEFDELAADQKPGEDIPRREDIPKHEEGIDGTLPASHVPEQSSPLSQDDGTQLIIVDTMTQLANELFSRLSKPDAHTQLTHLSSRLHHLARTQNLLIILHNTTVPVPASVPVPVPPPSPAHKPALGRIFTQLIDLHLWVTRRSPASSRERKHTQTKTKTKVKLGLRVLKDECPPPDAEEGGGWKSPFALREGREGFVRLG